MVPFGERAAMGKKRPVVILGWRGVGMPNTRARILVVPSYTFDGDPTQAGPFDLKVRDTAVSGLDEGSFICCGRLWSLAPEAFDFRGDPIGTLDIGEHNAVLAEVTKFFGVTGPATL